MFSRIVRALWGDLSAEEVKRFGMLSFTFLFIIGAYWLMRPLKDALFMDIVGGTYIPWAKMASVVVLFPLIMGYSKLVDIFSKQKLFYVVCAIYATLFFGIAYCLSTSTMGLYNASGV